MLGVWSGSVKYLFAKSAVANAIGNSTLTVVEPTNAVIATGIVLVVGIFIYRKRHKKDR